LVRQRERLHADDSIWAATPANNPDRRLSDAVLRAAQLSTLDKFRGKEFDPTYRAPLQP
jgi:hypothetical protein